MQSGRLIERRMNEVMGTSINRSARAGVCGGFLEIRCTPIPERSAGRIWPARYTRLFFSCNNGTRRAARKYKKMYNIYYHVKKKFFRTISVNGAASVFVAFCPNIWKLKVEFFSVNDLWRIYNETYFGIYELEISLSIRPSCKANWIYM